MNIGCGLKYTAMDAIMRVVYDIGLENKVQVFQFSTECFTSKSKKSLTTAPYGLR